MICIAFPDPLVWQAGIEYGLQGVAEVFREEEFKCILNSDGPLLEAVAFAVREMRIADVQYTDSRRLRKNDANIFLYPRVCSMEAESIQRFAGSGETIITSDPQMTASVPNVFVFNRRDINQLTAVLQNVLSDHVNRIP